MRENEPMLQMCRELGFAIASEPRDPAVMLVRKKLPRSIASALHQNKCESRRIMAAAGLMLAFNKSASAPLRGQREAGKGK